MGARQTKPGGAIVDSEPRIAGTRTFYPNRHLHNPQDFDNFLDKPKPKINNFLGLEITQIFFFFNFFSNSEKKKILLN